MNNPVFYRDVKDSGHSVAMQQIISIATVPRQVQVIAERMLRYEAR
jgi:hypothetical protein